MSYDLFVSYSRRDNQQGRVTQLVERIKLDFEAFAGRPIVPFFDLTEINGMEDWRHRILQALRESRLLLACLSPAFLESEYCEWEFHEYLKHEVARLYGGQGVAPIYFVEVPGWEDRDFESRCAAWVAELRRRQHFDLRPWYQAGEESLHDAAVKERMKSLHEQLRDRIRRGEHSEQSLGNVDAHNPHFIGRISELRRLRETVALGRVGVLTAVHGLGGVGKTALAIEYAHTFAHEYGGGRWQIRCEGKDDLRSAVAELASPLGLLQSDDDTRDPDWQFQRVLAELRRLADVRKPNRCLLLLDNVDRPSLVEPAQIQRLPAADWLHVIATTRLGANELYGAHSDRSFLPVDELPEADALDLIATYQPDGEFRSDAERLAACGIVRLLGRFTLAVETAAVYLGQFVGDVTCEDFLTRLKKEGLSGLETATSPSSQGVRHGEKRLTATLQPTLERLTEPEKLALNYAAILPPDHVALTWIRVLVARTFPEIGRDAEPGYHDPWSDLLRRLLSLRLLQITSTAQQARMHRLVQDWLKSQLDFPLLQLEKALLAHTANYARSSRDAWTEYERPWELYPTQACLNQITPIIKDRSPRMLRDDASEGDWRRMFDWAATNDAARLAGSLPSLFSASRTPAHVETRIQEALQKAEHRFGLEHPRVAVELDNLAQLFVAEGKFASAKPLFQRALSIDKQHYGPHHQNVVVRLNNLASLLHKMGQSEDADVLYQEAIETARCCLAADHPSLLIVITNYASLLHSRGLGQTETLAKLRQFAPECFGGEQADSASFPWLKGQS